MKILKVILGKLTFIALSNYQNDVDSKHDELKKYTLICVALIKKVHIW